MNWILTIPIASLLSDDWMLKTNRNVKNAKDGVILRTQFDNVYILRVNNAYTSFFTLFHSIEFIFTAYFA